MNFPCGPLDSIQLIALILFVLLTLQSLLGIGLGIGFLLQPPLYKTIIDLNAAFNRQAYFSIYAPHILLIIGSGIVAIPIIFGIFGIIQRRWRYLIISLALLSLYMAILSGACASGFAYYDRLRPTLENDVALTSASVWIPVRSTYNCTGTNCVTALENAMYANKQRIGIISAVFLLVPSLIIIIIMFQMRRDVLYFK
ncbi:unnamed protein product [Adineta steineri]|uniref:Uncharacterized protein n=1 Tax=Adineta steineri TaxID=433720 RepID=A0A815HSL3_9BILA|nr:unnamed protein product [Adineta steineri]CAF1319375.1 unnamed protein product [Adineta steineri]CAF1319600.1 unnamed protein product [Adineta steineri]CAF1356530.1 unnamed protein product [Adineta steineri]CAF1359821.1 unnamed protein product [Adineta steineri]